MFPETPLLVLASGSFARKAMLTKAGLNFECHPANINENIVSKNLSSELADRKALHVSAKFPNALVIGSDQTLDIEGKILSKANSVEAAKEKIRILRGKTHTLSSSVSIAQNQKILWKYTDLANLTMNNFDDAFLDSYAERNKEILTLCVGGYDIEGVGAWLFSKIEGDFFTIMGMPLLPLLGFLREKGFRP